MTPVNMWFQRLLWYVYSLIAYWRLQRGTGSWEQSARRGFEGDAA